MLDLQTEAPALWNRATVPAASIVTVNTNERHRLEVYLPSVLLSQGLFEVIISDNGSTDGSLDFVSKVSPAVHVLRNGRNIGFAAANNRAAEISRLDILVFINPDTSVKSDWLHYLLLPFSDPLVGLTTAKILLMSNPETINACGNDMHMTGLTLCRGLGKPKHWYREAAEVNAVSGAAFAIRRDLFDMLGGFDEDFFIYMEETDLCLRARLCGWKCVYVPQSIVFHDYQLRFGPNKVLYQERNRYLMLLKCLRWKTLVVLSPALALAEILTWGFVFLHDRQHWRNKLRAYRAVVVTWKETMRKRATVQRLRRIRDRELMRDADFALDWEQFGKGWITKIAWAMFTLCFLTMKKLTRLLIWW